MGCLLLIVGVFLLTSSPYPLAGLLVILAGLLWGGTSSRR